MNINDAIKILIDSALKAQSKGVFNVFEARDIANSIDEIERVSKEQERINHEQEKRQQVVPPVASHD